MKLARLGAPGSERLAIVDADGRYRDLSGFFPDLVVSREWWKFS